MNAIVSRRAVLAGGVAAGSLLAGGVTFVLASKPAPGALVLSKTEFAVIEQASRVLFPPGIFPVAGGDGETASAVDVLLADVIDPPAVTPFRSMLAALEWGTLVSRGTRFSELSEEEAAHVIDVWASENPAPRRVAFDSLQALLSMAFLRRSAVIEAIGWRVGCFE